MNITPLPLKVISVSELYNGENAVYEVPIYQRNYAWEKDEISALVQDVYNALTSGKKYYYIGTLVSFYKGDQVYEVIDGQQRLTTLFLILNALGIKCKNLLTYRARKKANKTIFELNCFHKIEEGDQGIIDGRSFVKAALAEIQTDIEQFKLFFQNRVKIIHYQVPRDIDLNHYFEVMNSRGEQLEMSEIIKARLMEKLNDADRAKFSRLWDCCSEMSSYVQQKYYAVAPKDNCPFNLDNASLSASSFDELPAVGESYNILSINDILSSKTLIQINDDNKKTDSFQPIIDFSNFLLIVLKITRLQDAAFDLESFILDDKELLNQFDRVAINEEFVKNFSLNLLKSKYFLDNFLVHHSCEDDTIENNPWKLQCWKKGSGGNLFNHMDDQDMLVHLLSMFEVSFTAKQRKNYLFYCLLYLFEHYNSDSKVFIVDYCRFLNDLADKYFWDIYMDSKNLNDINVPRPGTFDQIILPQRKLNVIPNKSKKHDNFNMIYGDGSIASKGIPLFIFNYLDYRIWLKYSNKVRGKKLPKGDKDRDEFFRELGCSDFDLRHFDLFYFSRTRRSLEHYFPRANVQVEENAPTDSQINCLGNYAMIGSEANSSGSYWDPKTKIIHYWEDKSKKIKPVSIASLKFYIMMQMCRDNQSLPEQNNGREWIFEDIKKHQSKMLDILLQ